MMINPIGNHSSDNDRKDRGTNHSQKKINSRIGSSFRAVSPAVAVVVKVSDFRRGRCSTELLRSPLGGADFNVIAIGCSHFFNG